MKRPEGLEVEEKLDEQFFEKIWRAKKKTQRNPVRRFCSRFGNHLNKPLNHPIHT